MNRHFIRHLQMSLIGLDLFMINMVFITGSFLLRGNTLFIEKNQSAYLGFFLISTWLLASWIENIYKEEYIRSFELFFKKSLKSFIWFFLFTVVCLFYFLQLTSRTSVTIFIFSAALALLINRFAYLIIYKHFSKKDFLIDKVVVLGYNNLSKKIIHFLEERSINKQVIGICDKYENVNELYHYPILGSINDALEVCKKFGATEIYSTIAPEYEPKIYELIQLADENCIHFRIVPDTNVFINRRCHLQYIQDLPVFSLRKEPLEDLGNRIKKRLFDFIFSFLVLVLILSWLIPLISLIIWLDSKGPVFFIQARSGKANRKFSCIKFRSMYENDVADKRQATKNDERLTRIGKLLRHTSLDEFPQFLNVLKGDMSIAGPRPHMLKHTEEYSQINNQYMVRHFLKPGITGWAQVNGFRGEITSIESLNSRIKHDLWYLENWSIWLDMKIIYRTVINIFKGDEKAF